MHTETTMPECSACRPLESERRERGVRWVFLLTAAMMIAEITIGYTTGSMALLADGWHMATHVGALGLALAAYALSRRYASHRAFSFGTGKLRSLAGYTSAVGLGLIAISMLVESFWRLFHAQPVAYASALPVAAVGLLVNLASVILLHANDEDHAHSEPHPAGNRHAAHDDDHNHRAAFMHVVADTFTSMLAIGALLAGHYLQIAWLDAASGVVGGLVILHWGLGLSRSAAAELLDVVPSTHLEGDIRQTLEKIDDVRVADLHLWSLGGGTRSCMVTLVTSVPRDANAYRDALSPFGLSHLTIEVQRCAGH